MWSRVFWKAAAERAISTAAQFALTLMGTEIVNYTSLDYREIATISLIGAVTSVLKSLVVAGASDGTPSIGSFEKLK